jgi:hypothetical protein
MGNDLNPGALSISTCGQVTPPVNWQPESIAIFSAFFNAGCPLTYAEKSAIDAVVIIAKSYHTVQIYALPILTLDSTGTVNRSELQGAISITLALLEGEPLNVIVDSGTPDITLNATAGTATVNIGSHDYSGQRLFMQYKKGQVPTPSGQITTTEPITFTSTQGQTSFTNDALVSAISVMFFVEGSLYPATLTPTNGTIIFNSLDAGQLCVLQIFK